VFLRLMFILNKFTHLLLPPFVLNSHVTKVSDLIGCYSKQSKSVNKLEC